MRNKQRVRIHQRHVDDELLEVLGYLGLFEGQWVELISAPIDNEFMVIQIHDKLFAFSSHLIKHLEWEC